VDTLERDGLIERLPTLTTGGPAAGHPARRPARAVGRAPEADQRNLLALESLRTVLARHFEL
jgi:hypothetical protein